MQRFCRQQWDLLGRNREAVIDGRGRLGRERTSPIVLRMRRIVLSTMNEEEQRRQTTRWMCGVMDGRGTITRLTYPAPGNGRLGRLGRAR